MSTVFDDAIVTLVKRARSLGASLETEEATKNALVMPFLQALGYDVFNPRVVVPEFTADHGIKKGEKVDYAIKKGEDVIILVECKTFGTDLSQIGASQLYRYFSVTPARISILTNGSEYRFFSDLETNNKMDQTPFFIFDLMNSQSSNIHELSKFRSENFEIDPILETAEDLKYMNLFRSEITQELEKPSDDFVELLARRFYSGRLTSSVRERLAVNAQQAMRQTLRDFVNRRLSDAQIPPDTDKQVEREVIDSQENDDDGVVTTDEEVDAFNIIRAILREYIEPSRITMKDGKSYCSIRLDNNNRRTIARLYLEGKKKRIGIFSEKQETKYDIVSVDEIFGLAESLKQTVSEYQ